MNQIKIGSGLLFVQNLLILAFMVIFVYNQFQLPPQMVNQFRAIVIGIFFLDLIGFLFLTIGFLKHSRGNEEISKKFRIAALGILGWLISRSYLQYRVMGFLEDGRVTSSFDETAVLFWFTLSSFCLLISGLSKIHNRYMYFTALNFSAVWTTQIAFLLDISGIILEVIGFIKIITVPVLAIFTFRDMYRSNLDQPKSEKYATTTYPTF